LLAELCIGYAGFLAIFLIFARREGKFSPADGVRVRAIIFCSFFTIFASLVPLLLTFAVSETPDLWRLSSASAAGAWVPIIASVGREQYALPLEHRAEVGRTNHFVAWGLVVLSVLLLVGNAIGLFGDPAAFPYLCVVAFGLGPPTSNFVTLAIHRLL
jgi:hypothetical protein